MALLLSRVGWFLLLWHPLKCLVLPLTVPLLLRQVLWHCRHTGTDSGIRGLDRTVTYKVSTRNYTVVKGYLCNGTNVNGTGNNAVLRHCLKLIVGVYISQEIIWHMYHNVDE